MRSESFAHGDVAAFISRINRSDIASIRTVTAGIVRLLEDPRATVRDLTDIIEVDPPLTGKILSRANSASCYTKRSISDIEQAILWIGFDNLKEIALSQKVCEIFLGGEELYGYSRLKLWKHSVAVAVFAKTMFRREFGEQGGLAYSAGLLHDIGIIALDQLMPESFITILACAPEHEGGFEACEREVLGFDHCQAGQALAFDWDLPEELILAIGSHSSSSPPSASWSRTAAVVHLADQQCESRGIGYCERHPVDPDYLEECRKGLGISHEALDLVLEETMDQIGQLEEQGVL